MTSSTVYLSSCTAGSIILPLLLKLHFAAPGDMGKTQIHATFEVYVIAQRQRKVCWEKSGESPAISFCSSSTSVIS